MTGTKPAKRKRASREYMRAWRLAHPEKPHAYYVAKVARSKRGTAGAKRDADATVQREAHVAAQRLADLFAWCLAPLPSNAAAAASGATKTSE